MDMDSFTTAALERLRTLTDDPAAEFRDGQLEAITDLVADRDRVLCVQRTGWGKSAVYFVATSLLRDPPADAGRAASGPTLIISPLLALMRNQLAAAGRLGLAAHTVNSTNREEWDQVRDRLAGDGLDLLLISPERLNNPRFREEMLPLFASSLGLLVIDEAHCISDWGHDFRPDYRRVGRDAGRARARATERAGFRCSRPRPPPTIGSSPTSPSSSSATDPSRRSDAAQLPRTARPREPAPGGRRARPSRRAAGLAGRAPAGDGRLGHRLHAHQARRRSGRRVPERERDHGARLQRRPGQRRARGDRAAAARPTRSRRWWRRARSGWATTSPTWGSSCTTRRPGRSWPTTSRWGARAAASSTPTSCCCAARRTAGSRTSSSSSRSPRASGCRRCSPNWRPRRPRAARPAS